MLQHRQFLVVYRWQKREAEEVEAHTDLLQFHNTQCSGQLLILGCHHQSVSGYTITLNMDVSEDVSQSILTGRVVPSLS